MRKMMIGIALALVFFASLGIHSFSEAQRGTIGFSVSTLANPFFVSMKEGGEAKAKELGVRLITMDAQDSPEKQISQVEDLIARKVDVIILNPVDSNAVVSAVLAANKARIPVITVTRPSNGGEVVQHLSVDNIFAGKLIGEELARVLKGKGNVAILEGRPGVPSATDRQKGFLEALKSQPGIKVVVSLTANYSREEGARVMEDILQAHPNLDAVYCHNDEMALGAIRTIIAAKRKERIKVFGIDAIADARKAIQDGDMVATVKQQPFYHMGKAVESAFKVMRGERVEKLVLIPLKLVTKENVME